MTAHSQDSKRPAESRASLPKGVYAVLREGKTRVEAQPGKVPHAIVLFDRDGQRKYVALDTESFVPLVLTGPAETTKNDRGRARLSAKLEPEYAKKLESLTRAHLGDRIAMVIGGQIVAMPTVRSVIEDGQVVISGCQDDDCQAMRTKLEQ